jgi:hypothetical protein
MNAVFPYSPSNHHNMVARFCLFLIELPGSVLPGHYTDSARKDQRFANVPIIKPDKSLWSRDTRAISSDTDT